MTGIEVGAAQLDRPDAGAVLDGQVPDDLGGETGVYKNMTRGIVALVFRCKVTGGQLTTNSEVTAFRWADETTIRQLTTEAYAVRFLDALRQDTTPAIRQHDGTELID